MSVNDIRDVAQSRLTFSRDNAFQKELRRRVDDYFRGSNRSQRDCPAMYLKTAIILTVFGGFYSLLVFVAVLFLTLAFGLPLLVHPLWIVLLFYVLRAGLAGVVVSVVFQLAHCVEEAEFPLNRSSMENVWAVHQFETTVDFARGSKVVSWLLGGLNFQIEHHLFPRVCHVNYPAISNLVEQTCRDFGVRYGEHSSFLAGLSSHFRWLRRMGARTAGSPQLVVAPEHGPA